MKYTREDLKIMQGWSLQRKIQVTQTRIMEWYIRNEGKVYISFSGGKDSTVLLDLARRMYPDSLAVFANTGLEYPEIREFATSKENVTAVKPLKYDPKKRIFVPTNFREVCETYGYPIISKEVAKVIYYYRQGSEWAIDRINGAGKTEKDKNFRKRFAKYKYLTTAPFAISGYCCDMMKKYPFKKYERETGNKPIIATMACESQQRESGWLKTGCNMFESDRPASRPMSFWSEQDVLQYLKITGIPYASVYGDIVTKDSQLSLIDDDSAPLCTTGCDRTGCMFCCFGIMSDPAPNRFQRMKTTHPRQYEYCIGGGAYDEKGMLKPDKYGLGIGKVLDYIGISY